MVKTFEDLLADARVAIDAAQAAIKAVMAGVSDSPVSERIVGSVNAYSTSALNLLNDASAQVGGMETVNSDAKAAVAAGSTTTNATDQHGNAVDTTNQAQ